MGRITAKLTSPHQTYTEGGNLLECSPVRVGGNLYMGSVTRTTTKISFSLFCCYVHRKTVSTSALPLWSSGMWFSSEWVSTQLLYSVPPEWSQTTSPPRIGSRGHPSHKHSYYNQPRKQLSQQFLRGGRERIHLFVFCQKCKISINASLFFLTLCSMRLFKQRDFFRSPDLVLHSGLVHPVQVLCFMLKLSSIQQPKGSFIFT